MKKTRRSNHPTRRSSAKFPNLDHKLNIKNRQRELEVDYIDKLNDKEKAWLDKFNKEFVNASFDTKNPRKNLHKSEKKRRECYNRNNARNRCLYTRNEVSNMNKSFDDVKKQSNKTQDELENELSDTIGLIGIKED